MRKIISALLGASLLCPVAANASAIFFCKDALGIQTNVVVWRTPDGDRLTVNDGYPHTNVRAAPTSVFAYRESNDGTWSLNIQFTSRTTADLTVSLVKGSEVTRQESTCTIARNQGDPQ